MEQPSQSWSIIIFCYNEEGNLPKLIEDTISVLQKVSTPEHEIIIVDDGSIDKTNEHAQHYSELHNFIKVISHETNFGIGAALRSGYNAAQYENVCAIPGDGQFDVRELLPYANVPPKTIIAFYRAKNLQYSLWRETLSYINKKLNEAFLGVKIRDVNWIKIYKLEELRKIQINLTSSLLESEICCKLIINGNKLQEVASNYFERKYGVDKGASSKIVSQALNDSFKLIAEVRRYRSKVKQS